MVTNNLRSARIARHGRLDLISSFSSGCIHMRGSSAASRARDSKPTRPPFFASARRMDTLHFGTVGVGSFIRSTNSTTFFSWHFLCDPHVPPELSFSVIRRIATLTRSVRRQLASSSSLRLVARP